VAPAQPVRVALAAALHLDAPNVACHADETLNPEDTDTLDRDLSLARFLSSTAGFTHRPLPHDRSDESNKVVPYISKSTSKLRMAFSGSLLFRRQSAAHLGSRGSGTAGSRRPCPMAAPAPAAAGRPPPPPAKRAFWCPGPAINKPVCDIRLP